MPNQANIIGLKSLGYKYHWQITAPSGPSTVWLKHSHAHPGRLSAPATMILTSSTPCLFHFPIIPRSSSLAQPNPAPCSKWTPVHAMLTISGQKAISLLGVQLHPMTGTALSLSDVYMFHHLLSSLVSVKEDWDLHISAPSLTCFLPNLPSHILSLSLGFSDTQSSSSKTILCLSRDSTDRMSPTLPPHISFGEEKGGSSQRGILTYKNLNRKGGWDFRSRWRHE